MKNPRMTPQRVRIIGGFWRSRLVDIVSVSGLRPSTDRVRETVFNWLNPYIADAKVIDLFAGTGILGLEACSRGAKEVVLIEKNPLVAKALQANLEKLKPYPQNARIECISMDALQWLKKQEQIVVDIIFLDPPFDQVGLLEEALQLIALKTNSDKMPIIYVESSSKLDNEAILGNLPGWVVEKQLVAGAVRANIFRYRNEQ
ncbi:MAG: 16S rRNA (guanine(966)-N(2))-methyltransferase RsmD [Betaproteobacteria bacterium]|jgi:16S rRNA (guanine966-N2)-methyltransferase